MTTPEFEGAATDLDGERSGLSESSGSEAGVSEGARVATRTPRSTRRRRRVRVLAAVAVASVVAFLVVSGVQAQGQRTRTTAAFALSRSHQRDAVGQLARTEAHLATVLGQAGTTRQTLTTVTGQLSTERAQVAAQQKNLFIQGVSISALDTCLGGVEAALNQVALNDQNGAAATLRSVGSSCHTAGATGG